MARNFVLHDWNDARLLIVCAERGSFAAAAAFLGLDQTTVSTRIAYMEEEIGRPLFYRRRSGARPTVTGMALLARAKIMADGAAGIEQAMRGQTELPTPVVTVAATDGLLEFTIKPALRGQFRAELPIIPRSISSPLPPLAFSNDLKKGDIVIEATNPGELPRGTGRVRVRGAGKMRFVPVAAREYLKQNRVPARFDDLIHEPLVDIAVYREVRGLDPWNHIATRAERSIIFPSTPHIEEPVLSGKGITVLAPYAELYDKRVAVIDMPVPEIAVSLWVTAHEDTLREPAARLVYDLLAGAFRESPFFGQR